ncbi:MAG: maleylpyruvate isomerase family mycothiol-dependent enzyme [Chloroflexi bacterium]|nr:MAG: maleylpyruvate isomerase family mycothiol-dependent enzyme [Chloroflexota bacterium]
MADPAALADLDPFDLLDTETGRLDRHFASLDAPAWEAPSRCAGWRTRDVLAHLCGSEEYNRACLDDRLADLFAQAQGESISGVDDFNAWQVRRRLDRPVGEVLTEWRAANADSRRRMRERGRDGLLPTMVGPYPVGLQAFHLAVEGAVHADDIGAPVTPAEAPARIAWQARFARFAIAEANRPARLERQDSSNRVRLGDEVATLDDGELVAAVTARLPEQHPLTPGLRAALRVLA